MKLRELFSNPINGVEKAFAGTVLAGVVGSEHIVIVLEALTALAGIGEMPPEQAIQTAMVKLFLVALAGLGVYQVPNSPVPSKVVPVEDDLPEPVGIDPDDV